MAIFRSCSNVSDRFLLREQQVMLQATGGKMNKQVANEQGISEITVEKSSRAFEVIFNRDHIAR